MRKGFLNYRADKEAVDALVKPQMRYSYQEGGVTGTCTGNAACRGETQVKRATDPTDEPSPVLLFVFYGQESRGHSQIPSRSNFHRGNVYAVDIPYEQKDEQTYEFAAAKLLAIDRGGGVLACVRPEGIAADVVYNFLRDRNTGSAR